MGGGGYLEQHLALHVQFVIFISVMDRTQGKADRQQYHDETGQYKLISGKCLDYFKDLDVKTAPDEVMYHRMVTWLAVVAITVS